MRYIATFLFLSIFAQQLLAQSTEDYHLLKVIQAKDLVVGSPSDVLFTQDMKHLIISYDAKPTYLAVYETTTWKKVNQIEVPGFLYLGQSHMDCENEELLYADYGNNNPKYYSINILSDYREKIKTKDLPEASCGHAFLGKSELREQKIRVQDKFMVIINHSKKMVTVLAKKAKRT